MGNKIHIYCSESTNRVKYVFDHIFIDRWKIDYDLHFNSEDFDAAVGAKLNYTTVRLLNAIQVIPQGLLYEKGINSAIPEVIQTEEYPLMFPNHTESIGHDVFAAVFYCLSRMEENDNQIKDQHGRFTSSSSLFHHWNCTQFPLVDFYVNRLKLLVTSVYPELEILNPHAQLELTFDIDRVFQFRSNSWFRAVVGSMKDFVTGRSFDFERIKVKLGVQKDAIDVYSEVLGLVSKKHLRPIFFFQMGGKSEFDVVDEITHGVVEETIQFIAENAVIGLHPSYRSSESQSILYEEYSALMSVIGEPVSRSRQHYLRMSWPDTFKELETLGITDEYSMGYPDFNGFRAGTSFPFLWYDVKNERISGIRIHPMIWMDMVSVRTNNTDQNALVEMEMLFNEVKKFGGIFSVTFHPDSLNGIHVPRPTKVILDKLMSWESSN